MKKLIFSVLFCIISFVASAQYTWNHVGGNMAQTMKEQAEIETGKYKKDGVKIEVNFRYYPDARVFDYVYLIADLNYFNSVTDKQLEDKAKALAEKIIYDIITRPHASIEGSVYVMKDAGARIRFSFLTLDENDEPVRKEVWMDSDYLRKVSVDMREGYPSPQDHSYMAKKHGISLRFAFISSNEVCVTSQQGSYSEDVIDHWYQIGNKIYLLSEEEYPFIISKNGRTITDKKTGVVYTLTKHYDIFN